jgi:hypothetical protein
VRLTPEFILLTDCCRWNFEGGAQPRVKPPAGMDWALFVRLARYHRVQGLAWKCLGSTDAPVPDEAAGELSSDAAAIAASNLRAAAECRDLLRKFDQAGVPLLFLKGLTLGALAYRTSAVKSAVDIDLLVPPNDLGRAADLLRSLDYEVAEPRTRGRAAIERWHASRKESLWVKQDGSLRIDLHTRLADNSRLLARLDLQANRRDVDVGNRVSLPTLGGDELFAYLAVHGSSSAWFRLKWIADFAALLAARAPAEIDRLYSRALELGAGRAPAQALLLADALFNTLGDNQPLRAELCRDRAAGMLYRAAFRQLAARREPREPTATRLGTATIHWTQLLLLPAAGFKLSEAFRQSRAALTRA